VPDRRAQHSRCISGSRGCSRRHGNILTYPRVPHTGHHGEDILDCIMLASNRHIISLRYLSPGRYAFLGMLRSRVSSATATIFAQACACLQWQIGVVLLTHPAADGVLSFVANIRCILNCSGEEGRVDAAPTVHGCARSRLVGMKGTSMGGKALTTTDRSVFGKARDIVTAYLVVPSKYSYKSGGSFMSAFSFGSFMSVLSIASDCSVLSIGSHGSILSIGSAGSILSVGSAASILSIGGVGTLPGERKT
jgi:hypothetical protein